MSTHQDVNNSGIEPETGLTPIHQRIHCAATLDTFADANELDVIAREIFIDTLVEVALAIARRKIELET